MLNLQIITQAAKFVRDAGRQSIFVLRVKQAHNPRFAFLMPNDPLNPYFEWMIREGIDVMNATQVCLYYISKILATKSKICVASLAFKSSYYPHLA